MYMLFMLRSSQDNLARHKHYGLYTQLDHCVNHAGKQLRIPMQELVMQWICLQPLKTDIKPSINISHHVLDLKVNETSIKAQLCQLPDKLPTRKPPIINTTISYT